LVDDDSLIGCHRNLLFVSTYIVGLYQAFNS